MKVYRRIRQRVPHERFDIAAAATVRGALTTLGCGPTLNQMVHYERDPLGAVFGALADPTRRAVLTRLRRGERSAGELAQPFGMSLTGFMKHLGILEDAGLIERRKTGRIVNCRLKGEALKGAMEWLDRHEQFWNAQLDRLGTFLERKEKERWKPQSTTRPASKSAATTRPRSPRSTRRARTRSR